MRIKIILETFYVVLLGVTLGATITIGAIVAPTIFKAALYIGSDEIDLFASGRLMSEIFRRYAVFVGATILFSAFYEIWRFWKDDRLTSVLILTALAFVSGGLFAWYYAPTILALQAEGVEATQTIGFNSLHSQSVSAFKIFTLSVGALLIYRVSLLVKGRSSFY
ncbi:MAG: DUF4149 domain-containing protein [Helicobacteraceae bacterium]|jgi:hypothetical protein|nr:DUF4149 domain-containing protein [Helicobacteraceae bacterium]